MRNTRSEALIDLRLWRSRHEENDNGSQLERLTAYLPLAVTQELTERQRQIVTMFFYEEKSVSQIARELQLHPSTVSRTLHRAIQRLHRVLQYSV